MPENSVHLGYVVVSRGDQILMLRVKCGILFCKGQHNTAAKPLHAVLYPRRMESSYTVVLHSLLRLLIPIMRGKIVFASVSCKFLTFLVSKAGYI